MTTTGSTLQARLDRLAEAAAAFTELQERQVWTREKRDRLIVAAVEAGASQREVAKVAGLSHTAIQEIVRRSTT